MKQVAYRKRGCLDVCSTQTAEDLESDEVLVEVAYTGICGTDLHIFAGEMDGRVAPGTILGHEMSGRIAAVASSVDGWTVGDPITVMPLEWCGNCPACVAGYSYVCQRLRFRGIDAAGCMQQFWRVPASALVKLPKSLPLATAALVEPAAVAVHDVRRAEVRPGEKVLILGGGPIGVLVATVARDTGADVTIAEVDAFRRGLAESLSFRALDPAATDIAQYVDDWTDGAGAAVSFEVSGSSAGLATAVECLAVRGRLCVIAIHTSKPSVDLHRIFWRELTVLGARLYDKSDFEEAAHFIDNHIDSINSLISKIYPICDAHAAFTTLEAKERVMKVLIDCQGL